MNNKRVRTKAMAMAVAAAMAVELCPVTAFAVTGDQVQRMERTQVLRR